MDGVHHPRFARKPCPRPQQPFQLAALAQILVAAQRGDHLLTDLPTVTATFNDLEIGASAGGLLAEIHWRLLCGEHKIAAESASINTNKHKTWHYTFAQPAPRHQQLQGLTPNRPSQLLKISLGLPESPSRSPSGRPGAAVQAASRSIDCQNR